jgi:hypothetical protein
VRNLFVSGAGNALFVFIGSAVRKDQVRVRIYKPWKHDGAAQVQLAGLAGQGMPLDVAAASNRRYTAFTHNERGVADRSWIGESPPAARGRPAKGK